MSKRAHIRERQRLLEGIAPETVSLLKDRRLMRNENISAYLGWHHADLARELATVMQAVASEAHAPGRVGLIWYRIQSASTLHASAMPSGPS